MKQPNSTPTLDLTVEDNRQLRRLLWSVRANPHQFNLLIAICNRRPYRDALIRAYTQELTDEGVLCPIVHLDPQQPSLKACLQTLVTEDPTLTTGTSPVLVTVLGADELLGIRLQDNKSAQEQFSFSVQWTREGLRQFAFPVVLWVTPAMATTLAQQAPDFWSWRGGVFEFFAPETPQLSPNLTSELQLPTTDTTPTTQADPQEIETQIAALTAQDPHSPLLASLYNSLGQAYEQAIRYPEAETAYRKALDLQQATLPPPNHVNIQAELTALKEILAGFHRPIIDAVMVEVEEEIAKPLPDKSVVATTLETGLTYARNLQGFAGAIDQLRPHVQNAAGWLGEHGTKLLPLVGLVL